MGPAGIEPATFAVSSSFNSEGDVIPFWFFSFPRVSFLQKKGLLDHEPGKFFTPENLFKGENQKIFMPTKKLSKEEKYIIFGAVVLYIGLFLWMIMSGV